MKRIICDNINAPYTLHDMQGLYLYLLAYLQEFITNFGEVYKIPVYFIFIIIAAIVAIFSEKIDEK